MSFFRRKLWRSLFIAELPVKRQRTGEQQLTSLVIDSKQECFHDITEQSMTLCLTRGVKELQQASLVQSEAWRVAPADRPFRT